MRVAVAIWNARISPVFDVARQILIVEAVAGRILSRREETLPGSDPVAQAGRLAELGPDTLICGAISQPLAGLVAAKGVQVIPFIAGEVEQVVTAYLAGTLWGPAWSMPGSCGRWRRSRGQNRGCGCRRGQRGGGQ